MFLLLNSVVQTFLPVLLLSQIILIHGQVGDDDDLSNINNFISGDTDELLNTLNGWFPGRTFQYTDISALIKDTKLDNDRYELQLRSDINDFLGDKIIIGQLANINQIISVKISFHDDNGDIIRDYLGNPVEYTSTRQEIGHVLEILQQGFEFSYARCLLQLQPNTNFDYRSLFFHFTHPSSSSTENSSVLSTTTTTTTTASTSTTTYNNVPSFINGSTTFSIDTFTQTYNTSAVCPNGSVCMWLLDNDVIAPTSNATVQLTFETKHIGNRLLKYVRYAGSTQETLASLSITISSSRKYICQDFNRQLRNRWVSAGNMSSPRIFFTVTYLSQNQYILIAGGTADSTTALSSYEIYDPRLGCYNVSNATYPRMKHTANYYNDSDVVLLIGGLENEGSAIENTEFISLTGVQTHISLPSPRSLHEAGSINGDILVFGGLGTLATAYNVLYHRATVNFQDKSVFYPQVKNFEGHSETTIDTSKLVLVFGGYFIDDSLYSNQAFVWNGTNVGGANNGSLTADMISPRAYHQATYIPSNNNVLITGGHNGDQTFSDCYLYYPASESFNSAGSLHLQRAYHAAVSLSNGSVLIIGGVSTVSGSLPSNPINSVERFDSTTQTFTTVAPLNVARYRHKAVYLPQTNEILVFGGIDASGNILSSFEYIKLDPSSILIPQVGSQITAQL